MKPTCPVCNGPATYYHDTLDGWCLMEESVTCEKGCYSYEYRTGETTFRVGSTVIGYYHTATFEYKERAVSLVDRLIERMKKKNRS